MLEINYGEEKDIELETTKVNESWWIQSRSTKNRVFSRKEIRKPFQSKPQKNFNVLSVNFFMNILVQTFVLKEYFLNVVKYKDKPYIINPG